MGRVDLSYLDPSFCLRREARRGTRVCVSAEFARGRFLDVGCSAGIATTLYGRRTRNRSMGVNLPLEMPRYACEEAGR